MRIDETTRRRAPHIETRIAQISELCAELVRKSKRHQRRTGFMARAVDLSPGHADLKLVDQDTGCQVLLNIKKCGRNDGPINTTFRCVVDFLLTINPDLGIAFCIPKDSLSDDFPRHYSRQQRKQILDWKA